MSVGMQKARKPGLFPLVTEHDSGCTSDAEGTLEDWVLIEQDEGKRSLSPVC